MGKDQEKSLWLKSDWLQFVKMIAIIDYAVIFELENTQIIDTPAVSAMI